VVIVVISGSILRRNSPVGRPHYSQCHARGPLLLCYCSVVVVLGGLFSAFVTVVGLEFLRFRCGGPHSIFAFSHFPGWNWNQQAGWVPVPCYSSAPVAIGDPYSCQDDGDMFGGLFVDSDIIHSIGG